MDFVKIILFISLICGLYAKLKIPAGSCVSKIVNGKLVQVGDCKKDDGSEIARLIQKSLDEKKKAEIKCDVTYKTKCFRVVVYRTDLVTLNDAEKTCKSRNGKPANIYDLAHYQSLLSYLRSIIPAGEESIDIWTGMEYKNDQLLQASGEPSTIATEVWFPKYPITHASYTNVVVQVNKDPESSRQGIYKSPGVICEI
ncbi:uncharacterized protein LOC120345060 [Styela clava]